MTWARCRGGNPLGTSRAVGVGQEAGEPTLFVAAADPPDGGGVAFPLGGNFVHRFARGHGQDDAGALDLEEGEGRLVGDALQAGAIARGQGKGARFAAAHGAALWEHGEWR